MPCPRYRLANSDSQNQLANTPQTPRQFPLAISPFLEATMQINFIRELDLGQIEANVVIVLINDALGHHRVLPYWECDIPAQALTAYATREALAFAEQCGSGYVDFHIRDFRTAPQV